MKKMNLIIACSVLLGGLAACNGSESGTGNQSATTTSDTNMGTNSTNTDTSSSTSDNSMNNTPAVANKGPLAAQDSTFVMKAAMGGMMEVESSNVALQNAENERVKAFATMMVADHTKANNELKNLAAQHGITLPTALPPDKQKHIDDMRKMQGKAFDKHYVSMMLNDHRKDISEFDKQSKSGADADLKAWAGQTLPTLQMHRDSVVALSKIKM